MLKDMIRNEVAPLLKAQGFRKQAMTWNRDEGDVIQVLDIQPSRWNDRAKQEFTLNVGGLSKVAWETCWGKPVPKHITIEECCPTFRIGQILAGFPPEATDFWWRLTDDMSDAETNTIRDSLVDAVCKKCLPILDQWRTEADLLRAFSSLPESTKQQPANRLYHAILVFQLGRQEAAEEELHAFDNPKFRVWHDRVEAVKSRLGIRVPQ
jgi:hypothetical protein